MNLLIQPLFWLSVVIVLIVSYILGKKLAERKFKDNPYYGNPKIKKVMDDPNLLKEKFSNIEVTLSDGREHKIDKIIDSGEEVVI